MGIVHLVGAGPGAPDLITVRAAALLRKADIVFHDALVHPDTIALAINAHKVAVGKRSGGQSTAQRFINKRLIEAAARFDTVVRLKGGDPMLFGRAQEEIDALRSAGVAVEIVPGVTSALAASAEVGVSLTRRGVSRSVVFATPRVATGEDASDWATSVVAADTAVVYMGAGHAAEVAAVLMRAGMAGGKPVAVVENATMPGSSRCLYTNLAQLGDAAADWALKGPALILIGDVYAAAVAAQATSAPGGEVLKQSANR